MENEVWKDIKGYEGLYQVSNYARIKALKKKTYIHNGGYTIREETLLKLRKDKEGYNRIILHKNGKGKNYLVHRLVAEAFIPNPNNYPFVLHKKRVLSGGTNYVDNLYWGTRSDNVKDSIKDGTWNKPNRKHYNPIPVLQYDINGNFIKKWEGATHTPYNHRHIQEVCTGKRKTANGCIWRYADGTPQAQRV